MTAVRPFLRSPRATGGPVSDGMPFNAGPLRAARPAGGRTDTLPIDVPQGAYVIPADIVSALGEGDSEAGYGRLNSMFPESERQHRAAGGEVGPRAPIIAAGGEYVVHPESVKRLGGGDMKRGHDALDIFVRNQRRKTIKTLSKLPGPQR